MTGCWNDMMMGWLDGGMAGWLDDNVTGVHLVLVAVLGGAVADVEGVVEGDLVPVRHDLVDGRVVERGRQVAQQRGQALRGVQDVAWQMMNIRSLYFQL